MSYRSDGKANKTDKDKNAAFQERFHAILDDLLKEEDNKYCVDCDAKGPRWASWNLGVFMCIRCAGIHRKMGVHIARVKSVNLDSWTAEQVAMMQEIGNSRGRAVYEANLTENFRRPQTDSGIEAFIFAKYVQKKYIAKEWVPPKPNVEFVLKEPSYLRDRDHSQAAVLAEAKKKPRNHSNSDAPQPQVTATHVPAPTNSKPIEAPKPAPAKQAQATTDLISVDDLLSSDGADFGAFEGYTSDAGNSIGGSASADIASLQMSSTSQLTSNVALQTQHGASNDLADLLPNANAANDQGQGQGASKKSKDDILKLYSGMTAAGTPAMMQQAGMYGTIPGVPMQMYAQRPMTQGGGMMPGGMVAPGYPGYGASQQQMMMPNMQYVGHAQQVVPPSYTSVTSGGAGGMQQFQQQPQVGMQQFQQQPQVGMQQFQQQPQVGMQQFQQQPQVGMQQFQQQPQAGKQQFQQQPQSSSMQFQQQQQPQSGMLYQPGMQQYQPQAGMHFQQPTPSGLQYQQQHINMNMMNQQMAGLSMSSNGAHNAATSGASIGNGHGWP